jgi:16S rRNA (guanine966-N2)-methyltransferase
MRVYFRDARTKEAVHVRVIAGSAKGTPLQAVPGSGTRPISDRVKESLFNILGAEVEGARVLDLFAGTGSVGIEALSRGAEEATFVEKHPKAASVIRANLQRTHLQGRATVVQNDVFRFLAGPPTPFDLVYIAPPQYQGLWLRALLAIDAKSRLAGRGGPGGRTDLSQGAGSCPSDHSPRRRPEAVRQHASFLLRAPGAIRLSARLLS